jgi:5'-3' exonuclease
MGIKGFFALFECDEIIPITELNGKTIAIDAMNELYRTSLGMSSIKALTDGNGKSTIHIHILYSNILSYIQKNIKTIWVFDSATSNPYKQAEIEIRRNKKDKIKKEIDVLKKEPLFTESDEELEYKVSSIKEIDAESGISDEETSADTSIQINKKEKASFSVNTEMINDLKFMLDMLCVPWIEAPNGVEGECLAAKLTDANCGLADIVLSKDPDALLFGAKKLINLDTKSKKYKIWDLKTLLLNNELSHNELIKIGIALGCDFMKNKEVFKGIGIKTVIKKLKTSKLDDKFEHADSKKALKYFDEMVNEIKCPDKSEIRNYDIKPLSNKENLEKLLDWLESKNFNRSRIEKALDKVLNPPVKKPRKQARKVGQ